MGKSTQSVNKLQNNNDEKTPSKYSLVVLFSDNNKPVFMCLRPALSAKLLPTSAKNVAEQSLIISLLSIN